MALSSCSVVCESRAHEKTQAHVPRGQSMARRQDVFMTRPSLCNLHPRRGYSSSLGNLAKMCGAAEALPLYKESLRIREQLHDTLLAVASRRALAFSRGSTILPNAACPSRIVVLSGSAPFTNKGFPHLLAKSPGMRL